MANEKIISSKWTTELLRDAVIKDGEAVGGTKHENIKQQKEETTPAPNGAGSWPY